MWATHTKLLHQRSISKTHIAIAQWIKTASWIIPRRSTWLVCDTDQLESVSSNRIDEIRALNLDWLHRDCDVGAKRDA
jgi:hypothetical protein